MSNFVKILATASITAVIASGAFAQGATFTLEDAADDEVEDLRDDIFDDAERDVNFGNDGRAIGQTGSIALRVVVDDDPNGFTNSTVGLGVTYDIYDGINGSEFDLSYVYTAEDDRADTDRLTVGYQFTRDFTPAVYGYLDATVRVDNEADVGDNKVDGFLGFGAGYRILNTSTQQWAVQAGPGYRYLDNFLTGDASEVAYSVESNYYRSLSDTVFITNDTQLVGSETATTVSNDLAVSVSLSDVLALRTSLVSQFDGTEFNNVDNTSNTLGVSVVYSFN